MNSIEIKTQFEAVKTKAVNEWGAFRRFISAHPLTGFWAGMILGGGVTFGAHLLRFF